MTSDAQGAHPGAHVHSGTVSGHAPADAIIISDAHLLFTGDFKRAGVDLVVSGDGHEVVLHDYFKGEKRAALASPDGAHLTGDIINALTGHTQFAQADGSPSVAQVIGHVTKLTGTATAIRNGVSIILNQGDNVNKGDVVASGSDSTLGITFIDGTVFGLASNAKMVLNEMIYDPNGSDNKSLISLVAGTISFVAGATAKHGDMKVDTPVATMGIRGTAVLVEIDFTVPATGGAPPAKFQVLVEPDGTTGSYILFDKTTLTPIATVNQAGTQTIVNGQGGVNFLSSAQLSADAQKIITDVFALKFSDLNNPNTKTATNFTDSIVPFNTFIKTAGGDNVLVTGLVVNVADKAAELNKSANPSSRDHIPGPPTVVTHDAVTTELALTTHSATIDTVSGAVAYADINPGDVPTVSTRFTSFTYQNAAHTDVTATLTAVQLAAIKAVEAPLTVVQDPTNINFGTAHWTYSIADSAFDFLAAGEVLTLTYTARVDNNFALNNESKEVTFTITITGTNDAPVITTGPQHISFVGGKTTPGPFLTTSDATSGTLSFADADLTDTHTVSTKLSSALLSGAQISTLAPAPLKFFETALTASIAAGNDSTQQNTGTINWSLADLRAYLADFVPAGDTLTLVYTVTVTDSQGATSTQDITVTIIGNNTPAVVWVATTQSGSTGDWNDASNWETGTVPTATDDAIIITNQLQQLTPFYPVTINAAAFAKSVTMDDFGTTPPELDNNSTLQIGGLFNLSADSIVKNAGTINVGGAIEVGGTSKLTNSGTLNLAAGGDFKGSSSITNSGTLDVTGGALNVLVNIANAGEIKIDSGALLTLASGTIDGGIITSAGTIEIVGTGSITNDALANHQLTVDSGQTLTIDGSTITGGAITNTGATLKVNGTETATLNDVTVTGGSITDGGTVNVASGKTLTLNGVALDGGIITNAGTIEIAGTGSITNDALANHQLTVDAGQTLTIDGSTITGGAITNTGATLKVNGTKTATLNDVTVTGGSITDGGTLNVASGKTLTLNGVALDGGIITNAGTIEIAGTGSITNDALTNHQLTVDAGQTLTLDGTTITGGNVTDGGAINVTSGKTLTLNGVALDGGIINNAGTIEISGTGSITNNALANHQLTVDSGQTLTVDGTIITGGAITNSGATLKVNGTKTATLNNVTVAGGNIADGGTINVASGKTLTLNGVTLDGGAITNSGTIEITGSGSINDDLLANHQLTVDGGTVLTLNGTTVTGGAITDTGTINVDTGKTLKLSGVALSGGAITNSGIIDITGSSSVSNDLFSNTQLTVEAGQILTLSSTTVTGGTITDTGTIKAAGASNINGATLNIALSGLLLIDSGVVLGMDGTTVSGGPIQILGELDLSGHSFIDGSSVTNAAGTIKVAFSSILKLDNGTAINGGSLVNSGTLQIETSSGAILNGVTVSGGGTISVDEPTVATTLVLEGGTTITDGTVVNGQVGTIEVKGASGATFDGVDVTGAGLLQIDGASQLVLQDGATISGGSLTVAAGGLLATYGAGIEINAVVTNNGMIEVKDGTLKISTSISGTGSVRIDGGATFELNGSDDQTVEFNGANAVFKIDGSSFGGSIIGFAASDEIDLQNFGYDATTTATYVDGVLTIFHGTDSFTMTLAGIDSHARLAGSGDATHTSITFKATDDAPVFAEHQETGSIDEQLNTTGSSTTDSAGGTLHFSDVDLLDRPTATVTATSVSWTSADHHVLGTPPDLAAIESALKLTQSGANNGTVDWDYSIADGLLDFLAEGETLTFTATVTLTDGEKSDTATVIVTIKGHDDAPVITVNNPAAVTEGNTGTPAPVTVTVADHVAIADVDTNDVRTPYVTNTLAFDATHSTGPAPSGGTLASLFTLNESTGTISYDKAAFDYLAAGEHVVAQFTFNASSGPDIVPEAITITIDGANDAPVIKVTDPVAVTEGNAGTPAPVTVVIADHVTITDVDASDHHTPYVANTLAFDSTHSTGPAPSSGTLASLFTLDESNGTISYDKAAFDYLRAGQHVVAKFTFDASSGPDTDHETITITIDGANDAPSIVSETNAPAQAIMVAPVGITVLAAGVTTNAFGLNTETFNDQSVGHGTFQSTALGAEFNGSGSSGVFHGTVDGVSAAPFVGPSPGAPDTTNYFSVGGGGAETITFATEQNAFGLYWGSVDSYNTISFYDGLKLVASYSGADVAPLFSDGNQGSFASNGYVEFSGLGQFNKVVLGSTSNAFELDNISAGTIHSQISASVSGTLSVHDADIGDTLTASVIGNGTVQFTGADHSTQLPDGVNISALIDSHDITFDTATSNGGTAVLDWTYHPTNPDLDFLKVGDVLKITFNAQVSDGHGSTANQALTVELDGANNATNASTFKVVDGTTANDTFNNVGNNVTIFGGGGQDTFVFKPGFGSATIADFDVNNDVIEISKSLFATPADAIAHAHVVNSDLVITDAASDTITLKGIASSHLHDSNFHLV